jgi:hypothetical protein
MTNLVRSFTKLGSKSQPHALKIYSYGFLFKTVQILDLFLTYLSSKRQQILLSFPIEIIEKFKPLVDTLY